MGFNHYTAGGRTMTTYQHSKINDLLLYQDGIRASQISGAIEKYIDSGEVSDNLRSKFQDAYDFLSEIITANDLFTSEKQGVSSSLDALEYLSRAHKVVSTSADTVDTSISLDDLSAILTVYMQTINILKSNVSTTLNVDDLKKTSDFFNRYADLMLSHLSVPGQISSPTFF